METLVIIVAFWLILVGVYGALPLIRGEWRRPVRPVVPRPAAAGQTPSLRRAAAVPGPRADGLSSEVDLLRLEVEQLRSELSASSRRGRNSRPRPRRYSTGLDSRLPKGLRRHVQAVRQRETKPAAAARVKEQPQAAATSRPSRRRKTGAGLTPSSA